MTYAELYARAHSREPRRSLWRSLFLQASWNLQILRLRLSGTLRPLRERNPFPHADEAQDSTPFSRDLQVYIQSAEVLFSDFQIGLTAVTALATMVAAVYAL